MSSLGRAERLLLDCLKRSPASPDPALLEGLPSPYWEQVLLLASKHRVGSLLYHRLKEKKLIALLPDRVQSVLLDAYRTNGLRNLRLCGEVHRLANAMEPEDVPLIILKGLALANGVYDDMATREMGDVDLLAHPDDLFRISETLSGLGYAAQAEIPIRDSIATSHHLPRVSKVNTAIEIHWNITPPGRSYSIAPDEFWERRSPLELSGKPFFMLCPEDMLLHLCMHTSYHHMFAFGLRPSCDMMELAARFGSSFDWRAFLDRARGWGWQRGVYLGLRLAVDLLEADVPPNVLEELAGLSPDQAMVDRARLQVFETRSPRAAAVGGARRFLAERGLKRRLLLAWRRVFLPRSLMASRYSVPADSYRIVLYYPLRVFALGWRLVGIMWRIWRSDTEEAQFHRRAISLDEFLLGEGRVVGDPPMKVGGS